MVLVITSSWYAFFNQDFFIKSSSSASFGLVQIIKARWTKIFIKWNFLLSLSLYLYIYIYIYIYISKCALTLVRLRIHKMKLVSFYPFFFFLLFCLRVDTYDDSAWHCFAYSPVKISMLKMPLTLNSNHMIYIYIYIYHKKVKWINQANISFTLF